MHNSINLLTLFFKVLFMNKTNPLEDLHEIRRMMEGSSKFLSLSGLSGIFAGLTALAGAAWAYFEINKFTRLSNHYLFSGNWERKAYELELKLLFIAILILIVALGFGVLFTWLKAKRENKSIITPLSFRLVRSLLVPLFFGGAFTLGLYYHGAHLLIPSATLIFYGMSLLNASKYVHVDIKYLALCQMLLGVVALFMMKKPWSGLVFWAIGFGILHIVYGTIMYFKYDRKQTSFE